MRSNLVRHSCGRDCARNPRSAWVTCGKPNPLNPPCQGDLSLNSPLIRGARGVRKDQYWVFCKVSKETVQETLAKPCYMRKTQPPKSPLSRGDLSLNSPLIRGARGVRNDEYWFFAKSRKRLCKKPSLGMGYMRKTQPPKSPLSGGLVTQFPPDKGG